MTSPAFYGADGLLSVGSSIGRGGEGEVFALSDGTRRALKIYITPDAAREAKIRAMVAADLSRTCPHAAFPTDMAFRGDGSFAGFTMPLVSECQPIHELCSPASRRSRFPNADWRFLLRTAANVARLFAKIHATGAIVGDINGSGILVSPRAVATAIDADSFQWGSDHLCRVGVPEFTPPELQGRSLGGESRTVDHDGFGLAVLIFQLLFLGRHPHAGVAAGREVSLGDAIRQGRFAYSRLRNVRTAPPAGTLQLHDLPIGLRVLFERAFAIGIGRRPRASEWATELDIAGTELITCTHREGHHHLAEHHECPWCRIERITGRRVFGRQGDLVAMPQTGMPDLRIRALATAAIARGRAIGGEKLEPRSRQTSFQPSREAREFRSDAGDALFLARLAAAAPGRPTDRFTRRYLRSRDQLAGQLDAWRGRVGVWKVNRLTANLVAELLRFEQLGESEAVALRASRTRTGRAMLLSAMKGEMIRTATISGIGPRRSAALTAASIESAADVTRDRLTALPCMSEAAILALLVWRDAAAVRMGRGIANPVTPDPDDVAAVRAGFRQATGDSEATLRRLALELNGLIDEISAFASLMDGDVEAARSQFAQALVDIEHLGLPVPGQPTLSPKAVSTKKSKQHGTAKPKVGCPICGGTLVKRWARAGSSPNQFFLGCANYPGCSGSRPMRKAPRP